MRKNPEESNTSPGDIKMPDPIMVPAVRPMPDITPTDLIIWSFAILKVKLFSVCRKFENWVIWKKELEGKQHKL